MDGYKTVFVAAAAAFGLLPGVAVLQNGLGSPPNRQAMFAAIVQTFGALALLLVWLNRTAIKRWPVRKTTPIAIGSAVIAFIAIVIYLLLYGHTVFDLPGRTAVMMPLWSSGDLAEMINRSGSRQAAVSTYGADAIVDAVGRMGAFALSLTVVVLLLVYQTIFTALAAAFAIVAARR
jgi:hypothetical protein